MGKVRSAQSSVWELITPAKASMCLAGILAGVGGICSILPFVGITNLGLHWANGGNIANQWPMLILIVISAVAAQLLYGFALFSTHITEANLRFTLRKSLVKSLGSIPLGKIETIPNGVLRKMVADDTKSIHALVAHLAGDLSFTVASFITGAVYLFLTDWRLALTLTAFWLLVSLLAMSIGLGNMKSIIADFSRAQTQLSAATVEMVEGIKEIKNFQATQATQTRFQQARVEFTDLSYRWSKGAGVAVAVVSTLLRPGVVFATVTPLAILFVSQGWIHPVNTLPFFLVALSLPSGLITLFSLMQHIYEANQAALATAKLLAEPPLPDGDEVTKCTTEIGKVELRNVSFGYRPNQPVINNVSLVIPPRKVTAVVGASGGGKSTIAKLIARFYDVDAGQVLVGGFDVRKVSQEWLLAQIAIVTQEVTLAHASVRQNIALGNPEASDEQIIAAAEAAQIHERILELPNGYDTVLGDEGGFLSGGEQQRITIARAYLQNTPIVILDEATAMADPHSERLIHQALTRLAAGKTVILIAHRLATVKDSHQIVVMSHGQIAEFGSHEDLLSFDGVYARMWHQQSLTLDSATPLNSGDIF